MLFSERMKIDKEFQEWCGDTKTKDYKVEYCIASFISFMQSKAKDNYKTASHFSIVIPVDSDLSCDGCKWDGLQFGMRSPCETCKRFHSHHKDLYVKNQ